MPDSESPFLRGGIALAALCHEYCNTVDSVAETWSASDFTRRVLGLLPRIYITVLSLPEAPEEAEDFTGTLEEEEYAAVSASLARLFGEHDTYLETVHEDMKYSDTPIAASLSEQLADLYQSFYDFTAIVRELPADSISATVAEMRLRFRDYWSEPLCNALKVLNYLYNHEILTEE